MTTDRFDACALGATLLLSLSAPALAAPGDWPQFRGPNHDDVAPETGLLQDWPAEGPPLVWKATGLGDGYSGVAVVGGRIYCAGDKGDSSFVVALNAADGKLVWSAKLGKAGPGGDGEPKFNGPRATPTVNGSRLYAVGQYGEMVCLATGDGKELWRKDYQKDFGGGCPKWGYAESVLLDGGRVVATPGGADGSMIALNKESGALLWRSKGFTDAPEYSTPVIAEIVGARQYIQLTAKSVAGIAAADGKLLWRAPRRGNVAVIPSPVCRDNLVYVTSGYGAGCNLFKITAADGQFWPRKSMPIRSWSTNTAASSASAIISTAIPTAKAGPARTSRRAMPSGRRRSSQRDRWSVPTAASICARKTTGAPLPSSKPLPRATTSMAASISPAEAPTIAGLTRSSQAENSTSATRTSCFATM